jgi:hypothetical protein
VRTVAIPPALLAVVAVGQFALARTGDMTAWKGGGFGMFSTLDHNAFRRIDVVIEAPDRSEGLEIPPSLEIAAARATAYPADWLLTRLSEGVVAREQRNQRPATRVTTTVSRTDFDPATLHAVERPVRTFVYDAP